MNKDNLLALLAAQHTELAEVQTRTPNLWDAVVRTQLIALRDRVAAELTSAPLDVQKRFADLDLAATPPAQVGERIRAFLETARMGRAELERVSTHLRAFDVVDLTQQANRSIADVPALAPLLAKARLYQVAELAGVADSAIEEVGGAIGNALERLDHSELQRLVERAVLTEPTARELGLASAIYQVAEQDAALARAIRTATLDHVDRAASSIDELAVASAPAWSAVLTRANLALPESLTADDVGRLLAARFAALAPEAAFWGRLPTVKTKDTAALAAHYPGLKLAELFDDSTKSTKEKTEFTSRRIGFIQNLRGKVDAGGLLELDYSPESSDLSQLDLTTLGATPEEQSLVVATLKTYQRIYGVTRHVDDAHALLRAGFHSASDIASRPLDAFRARVPFDEATARRYWESARATLAGSTLAASSLMDVRAGMFDGLRVSNLLAAVPEWLRKLDGYETLFGSQTFCDCDHCQSVVGPAAYFVDLMNFIDEYIIQRQFANRPDDPLNLKVRRPDLWSLPLTCANTNDLVPTLQIANEILENTIARHRGYSGPLDDREAVAQVVYQNALRTTITSFRQPFHLPLARIESYLGALDSSRMEVSAALVPDSHAAVQGQFGWSPEAWERLTRSQVTLEDVALVYGVTLLVENGSIVPTDAQVLQRAMALSRDELGELVTSWYVGAGGSPPTIVARKRDAASVQNDIEEVHGLTVLNLERMYRFARLRHSVGCSFHEIDLLMQAAAFTGQLDAPGFLQVARAVRAWRRLGVSAEVFCALIGELPRPSSGSSLFDRLFNPPEAVAAHGPFPQPQTRFTHPALRSGASAAADPALPRLLAGLGVNLVELEGLVRQLAPLLLNETGGTSNPDAPDENDRHFVLSGRNLSVLFGHVSLARALRTPLADLGRLLQLHDVTTARGVDELVTFLDAYEVWQRTRFSLDDFALIRGQTPSDPSQYLDPSAATAQVIANAANKLLFGDNVFAVALETTEQGSRDIIARNDDVIERTSNGQYRIVAGIDLANIPIEIPSTAGPATEDEVRAVLVGYQAKEVAIGLLAEMLVIDPSKVRALAAFHGEFGGASFERAVRGDGPSAPLHDVAAWLAQAAIIFRAPEYDADSLALVRTRPDLFAHGTRDPQAPNVLFVDLARRAAKQNPNGAAELRSVLLSYNADSASFPPASDALIARVLGINVGILPGLRNHLELSGAALFALQTIDRAASLATRLNIDGEALFALTSDTYVTLARGADALLAAIRSRHSNEQQRAQHLKPLEQARNERKRDALTAYLLHSIEYELFDKADDLYAYFLADVQAGGCASTSRVVSAISTAQLYVQRVIMGLEQDNRAPSDPLHLRVELPAEALAQWSWRKNYRVWEANRKVFLWPENYLEPDLRDDKTPLFEELERDLLQTDITEQNVYDAYVKYLKGFEEVASLTMSGAYHHFDETRTDHRDTLHLFGVSSSDPGVHYHRTAVDLVANGSDSNRGVVWKPWRKLDVQVSSRRVSPVVLDGRLHLFWTNVNTRPLHSVDQGSSSFDGYQHTMSVRHSVLRADRSWSTPELIELPAGAETFAGGKGAVRDVLFLDNEGTPGGTPALDDRYHEEPIDDYTLQGANWEWLWFEPALFREEEPDGTIVLSPVLATSFRNFRARGYVDFYARAIRPQNGKVILPALVSQRLLVKRNRALGVARFSRLGEPGVWTAPAYANAIADGDRLTVLGRELPDLAEAWRNTSRDGLCDTPAIADLLVIPGSIEDAILQVGTDVLLLQNSTTANLRYEMRRIGTTLAPDISRRLIENGVDTLLSIESQRSLQERPAPLRNFVQPIVNSVHVGSIDFDGAYGAYYREIFFHIPVLIANALNGRGRFADAQRWYSYVFDPTANEVIDLGNTPPEDQARRLLDRVWRYIEFRNQGVDRLRQVLTNQTALTLYREDPFNPHGIARLRLSAYQKNVVMKYVDNLLDWADHLFTLFTTESLNEALMLYVMASDILGARPARLGACGEGDQPNTYDTIRPLLGAGREILIEIETLRLGANAQARRANGAAKGELAPTVRQIREARKQVPWATRPSATPQGLASAVGMVSTTSGSATTSRSGAWTPALSASTTLEADRASGGVAGRTRQTGSGDVAASFGWSILAQAGPVFCVPVNKDLLTYWDRVEDRLYKIRHCMDITGQRREVALFAPEIDPALLVRMKAAGLSLDEVLATASGNLPPYRFLYLLDRAKAFASTLSGFGNALLSALEKKDAEELGRLRQVQARNLAQLSTKVRGWEIGAAKEALSALERQQEGAQYRRDFYQGLLNTARSSIEVTQTASIHTANFASARLAELQLAQAITALIPNSGSPFAMTFGGIQLSGNLAAVVSAVDSGARLLQSIGSSAGLEATFERRREGWEHQRKLAEHDLRQISRQVEAAQLRVLIAERSLAIHEKSIEHLDEQLEMMDGKFTNLGLYTWLSTQLRRFHRDAYQNALSLARLAEQAFRFERGDDSAFRLSATHWDASHAGLLAGEQLLVELQGLERRYIETNYRSLEVDQPFALSQIAPRALVNLRETGVCQFEIPELFFDLAYPGHYRRRIKAVRLTIPCITGPYTNVSATLTLDESRVRLTTTPGAALVPYPPQRTRSVATSTAQNDAGVFELSFRDERYMPFEGAGAVSTWTLTLPKTFRQFDYQTINDVIISISYTAEQDGVLRDTVESDNAAVEGSIFQYLTNPNATPIARVISLRHEFSATFTRLLHSPIGTPVRLDITDAHLPPFLRGRALSVTQKTLAVRPSNGAIPGSFRIRVDGGEVPQLSDNDSLGGLPAATLPDAFGQNLRGSHTFIIEDAGGFAPTEPQPGDLAAIDADKLADLVVYLEYRLA